MRVRFWGVRGSVPWATPESIGHGCNTPCVEVRDERTGALLVLDAGSGIVGLGAGARRRAAPGADPADALSLGSHPGPAVFLAVLSARVDAVDLGADARRACRVEWVETIFGVAVLSGAVRPAAEPADGDAGRARDVRDRRLPRQRAAAQPSGRRVRVSDSRRRAAIWSTPPITSSAIAEIDEQLAAFCLNAAAVISDAHFTPEELPRHTGWGHASWRQVAEFASACGAGHLWLFHHKPGRTDRELADDRSRGAPRLSGDDRRARGHVVRDLSHAYSESRAQGRRGCAHRRCAGGARPRRSTRCSPRSPAPRAAIPFRRVELKTYDWRLTHTAQPRAARQDIALVEIDEYSLRNLEPNAGRWPWPRAIHSMLHRLSSRARRRR